MSFIQQYKKQIIILLTSLSIIFAITSVNRLKPTFFEEYLGFIVVPAQNVCETITTWVKDKVFIFSDYKNIKKENEYLKNKLYLLEEENKLSKLIKEENDELTALLSLQSKYKQYYTVGANIVSKDPGNWFDIFTIDKGSDHGFEQDMVVLSTTGLVGRILECGKNYSKVVSIIDDTNAVSGKCLRTGDIGYVRGDLSNKGMCIMEYIDSNAQIIEGDEIITSNLSDIYPAGITIGYVKEIVYNKNTLTKSATIEPTTDFRHLETVLVIQKENKIGE